MLKKEFVDYLKATYPQHKTDAYYGADVFIPQSRLAIYVLDHPLPVKTISTILSINTKRSISSLFLVDAALLPAYDEALGYSNENAWVLALHATYYGRVYAYDDGCEVRPVHLEYDTGSRLRFADWGGLINIKLMNFATVDCQSKFMHGTFKIGMFNDKAFWQTGSYWHREEAPRGHEQPRQESATPDEYATLGISRNTSYEQAKRAYRLRAMEYHPDRHPEAVSLYTVKMQDINKAWEYVRQQNGW